MRSARLSLGWMILGCLAVSCTRSSPPGEPDSPPETDASAPPALPAPPDAAEAAAGPETLSGSRPELEDAYRLRSLARLHADRDTPQGYRDAAEHLRRLVQLEPTDPADRLDLAKVLLFAGDVDECRARLAEARGLFAEDEIPPDLHYVEALCDLREERDEAALADLAIVLEKRPRHIHAWFQRGLVEERLGRGAEAETSYRRAVSIDPLFRAGLYRLALVLRSLGRTEEATEAIRRAASLPQKHAAEDEKCDLTAVTRRPLARTRPEPPEVVFAWRDITEEILGGPSPAGVRRAQALYRAEAAAGAEDDVSVSWGSGVYVEGARPAPRELLLIEDALWRILRLPPEADSSPAATVFEDAAPSPRCALAADLTGDERTEILVAAADGLRLYSSGGQGALALVPNVFDSLTRGALEDVKAFDTDHDGDLDLVAVERRGGELRASVLRNNGDGSFSRLEPLADLDASSAPALAVAAHDVDQANDLDLIFAGSASGLQVFLNRRSGSYSRMVLPAFAGRTLALVEDLGGDGAPDIFAAGGPPGWTTARNADPLGRPYELRLETPVVAASPRCGEIRGAGLADMDNDGDLDVVLAAASGVVLLRNTRGGILREEAAASVAGGAPVASIETADLTGDGRLEVIAVTGGGRIAILASGAEPAYSSWKVWLRGQRDNSNAIGAVVEQHCGSLYQSRMIDRCGPLHLGLAEAGPDGIDGLRVRWPQGTVQSIPAFEIRLDARGEARFTQTLSVVSSCPFLYTLGDGGWRFLTDVLGIAPLDEWLPEGQTAHLDPEEFVRIPGGALAESGGALRLAVTEELRETAYLDRLELIAVDHPGGIELFADESTRQPAYAPLRVFALERNELQAPGALTCPDGTDALEAARRRDGRFVRGFTESRPQWSGWVERHALEIAIPAPARALLLTGRIAWYDSSVAFSLAQHGRAWNPLSIERIGEDGRPAGALAVEPGLPAGFDRTMVVALGEEPLPAGARLRLSSHHRCLWDEVRLAGGVEELEFADGSGSRRLADGRILRWAALGVRRAELGYHGFSRAAGDRARHEQTYLFDETSPGDAFAPATGFATRYGDVAELLREHDDRLVVLVTGDRVMVELPAPPPLAPGRERTFFLRVSGWAKEGSFHNATGSSIEPLPLRGMSRYPPPDAEMRRDAEYLDYLEQFQTREVRRREP